MLEALDTLKETGLCREIPVLGLIDDNVIHGQIDNLALKPSLRVATETKIEVMPGPPSQRKRKAAFILREQAKKARMPSTESQDTPQALSVAADNEAEPLASRATNALACSSPHRYAIHLSDTKTRTTPDIPPDEDALAHRFQLMLYHRLLSSLMARPFGTGDSSERATTTSQPLDFAAVWRKLSLNPRRPFSDTFIRGARRLLDRAARSPTQGDVSHTTPSGSAEHRYLALDCLDDLVAAWQKAVERLDVDGIDTTLTLEYILQTPDKPDVLYPASVSQSQETRPSVDAEVVEGISQVSGDTVIGLSQDSEATAVGDGDEKATMGASASNSDDKAQLVAGMLGVKEFVMDDQMLDDHLRSILQYWHGHRQPKGAPAGLERRCEVCEYHQDCEWRDTEASF
ncbi:hypothetical protein EVJ58_g4701 [Rhodofomes roseus]|uniref:Uncharacterized protein n=1 Tax=Rhodofomes roseus TaxID=34475 RepID=A0A4Y9YHG5_9APHY|nr:hypothetical protein EVJ58_g4701 [Rhodofomes roseus]